MELFCWDGRLVSKGKHYTQRPKEKKLSLVSFLGNLLRVSFLASIAHKKSSPTKKMWGFGSSLGPKCWKNKLPRTLPWVCHLWTSENQTRPGDILLMVQKSGGNPLRLVVHPIIYLVLYIPSGAGFLPSAVCKEVFGEPSTEPFQEGICPKEPQRRSLPRDLYYGYRPQS